MAHTFLKNRLVTGLQFANGSKTAKVGLVAVNDDRTTDDGPEAVGFYFHEALDRLIPDEDKMRIANALIDLFNFAVECGEVAPYHVVGRTNVKVGYDGMRDPLPKD